MNMIENNLILLFYKMERNKWLYIQLQGFYFTLCIF